MTLSTPLLAAAPLVAGLLGPALIGATVEQDISRVPETPVAPAARAGEPGEAIGKGPARRLTAHRTTRDDVVQHVAARGPADQRRVLAYWTPERMAAALPISLLDLVTKGGGLLRGPRGGSGTGVSPGLVDGTLPSDLLGDHLPLSGGSQGSGRAAGSQDSGKPGVLGDSGKSGGAGAVKPRHQSARPLATTSGARWAIGGAVSRTTGRVFLTLAGVDFVCSASTVRAASRDLVVTAGHCVKDGTGEWADNWTFVPGYGIGGPRPYGQWTARRMFVAGPWSRAADDSYDLGMVALAASDGRHVADIVGTQDIAFNSTRGGHAYGFGYPADPPYDGRHLVYCSGRLRDDPYGDTRDQGLGCAMTAGSSGGPWLSTFDAATGRGTITSLSSFKYSNDQRTMYGPFFGESAKKLYLTAERA